jgi:superfamily I DNA/RNA helicase
MSVVAYEGPAGSGKTYALILRLQNELASSNLEKHQKVLALTFMHGSRRRLDARLRGIQSLRDRFDATTVDSFAWHVCLRWRALASALGYAIPTQDNYDDTCRLAAQLLEDEYVRASFPIILVDEAHDLSVERTHIVTELSKNSLVLLAYDEFQCLDETKRPIALLAWLPAVCSPVQLTTIHRTNVTELLTAARAVRAGRTLVTGSDFRFMD